MPAYGTRPTQVRLTDADKSKIEAIRKAHGLGTLAESLRYAVDQVYGMLPEPLKNLSGKSRFPS